jgi:hypothetical protein
MKKAAKSKARKPQATKKRKTAASRTKPGSAKPRTARSAIKGKASRTAGPNKQEPARTAVRAKAKPSARKSTAAAAKARVEATRVVTRQAKPVPKPTQSLAERVLSRRAAASATKTQAAAAAKKSPAGTGAPSPAAKTKVRRAPGSRAARSGAPQYRTNREMVRVSRMPQFTYMRAPGSDSAFNVGDAVEVYCDHEQDSERVRGWIRGVVVQVDNKLVAVQFRSNVFLTDGWMVPDRILWYPLASEQIRPLSLSRRAPRRAIPDY